MLSASDVVQLAHAASEHRAILTFNIGDFALLHEQYTAEGKEHWELSFPTANPLANCFAVFCGC